MLGLMPELAIKTSFIERCKIPWCGWGKKLTSHPSASASWFLSKNCWDCGQIYVTSYQNTVIFSVLSFSAEHSK